ncbi:MAG: ribosome maturation factor RimM, partial [Bacteroidota bacterium]
DSQHAAKEFVGSKLYLPLTSLVKLPDHQYYFHELIDCAFFDDGKLIGQVKEYIDLPSNPLLIVQSDKEILIPFRDEFIVSVDKTGKRIEARLPTGLLEINEK